MSPRCTSWTSDEDAKLIAACGDRRMTQADWPAVAAKVGPKRTWQACRQQFSKLRRIERGHVVEPRVRPNRAQVNSFHERNMQQPPHALPRHASLTAALCGDPLPGRSALDRRPQQ